MRLKKIREFPARKFSGGKTRAAQGVSGPIPYGRQWIDDNDIRAVVEALRSDWLTQGQRVKEFEERFAQYVGATYAVAVSSGTAALHVAYLAAGIGPGDEVITSPLTFVATANAAVYCGATPAFVDIDPDTACLDPQALEAYLEKRFASPASPLPRPKAIVPVHFSGLPCEMHRIYEIAGKYGLAVIEDACHALGAEYMCSFYKTGGRITGRDNWVKVGCCRHSAMSVFSFHPVKHITTGEGGMVTTNNQTLYERLLMLRNHGVTRQLKRFTSFQRSFGKGSIAEDDVWGMRNESVPSWYYEMQELGFNYRITDIQCALGMSQLGKLDWFVQRRRQIADMYSKCFRELGAFEVPATPPGTASSFHLYVLRLKKGGFETRQRFFDQLVKRGIRPQIHYIPVHHQPYYRPENQKRKYNLVNADEFYSRCISLPLFPVMRDMEVHKVISTVMSLGSDLDRGVAEKTAFLRHVNMQWLLPGDSRKADFAK